MKWYNKIIHLTYTVFYYFLHVKLIHLLSNHNSNYTTLVLWERCNVQINHGDLEEWRKRAIIWAKEAEVIHWSQGGISMTLRWALNKTIPQIKHKNVKELGRVPLTRKKGQGGRETWWRVASNIFKILMPGSSPQILKATVWANEPTMQITQAKNQSKFA